MAAPTEPPSESSEKIEALASDLTALGAESETARAVKRIVPWVLSVGIHAAMIVLGFLLTWTVVLLQRDHEPARIVADFSAVTYEPLMKMTAEESAESELLAQDRVETETLEDLLEDVDTPEVDLSLISDAASDRELARFAPEPTRNSATFVGLASTNARRIVYVIDASGSMIGSLPVVIEELARSLDGLTPKQEFSVIFFSGNRAIVVPPASRLNPGTEEEKVRVLSWVRDVIPSGRSNPMAAIEKAMSFRPDVIFMLSENITGSGEFEIDKFDLLARLEELNPVDPDLGRRRTQINCVQFLDPDPLGTLREIAEQHGGDRGYKFLDRQELGLQAR